MIDRVFAGSRPDYLVALQRRSATGRWRSASSRTSCAAISSPSWSRPSRARPPLTLGDGRRRGRHRDGNVPPRPPPRPRELPRLRHPRDRRRPARCQAPVPAETTARRRHLRPSSLRPRPRTALSRSTGRTASEPDLAGYVVYRGPTPGGPYDRLTPTLLPYSTYADRTPPADGAAAYYVVRAMDTSGNLSPPSPEATPLPAAP